MIFAAPVKLPGPACGQAAPRALPATSERTDVLGLRPLVTTDRGVLDALVLLQAAVSVGLDRRVMDEYIRRSVVGRDKAIALVRVEPFHCSLSHWVSSRNDHQDPRAC